MNNALARWLKRHDCYHAIPFLGFMIFYMVGFRLIEMIPRQKYYMLTLDIDRWFPFVEQFVLAYISWFVFMTVGIVGMYFMDRDGFDRLSTMLIIGMSLFLIISAVLPNRQPLRLLEMPRDNIYTKMIITLWKLDTPSNVWPSIHVYNTAVTVVAFQKCGNSKFQKLSFRLLTGAWGMLIILSTMFIKQHSIFDVVTALALTLVSYTLVYSEGKVIRYKRWDRLWENVPEDA